MAESKSPTHSLLQVIKDKVDSSPEKEIFFEKIGDQWIGYSYRQLATAIEFMRRALVKRGAGHGSFIGLVSTTSFLGEVLDKAIQSIGAIAVGLPNQLSVLEMNSTLHTIRLSGVICLDEISYNEWTKADAIDPFWIWRAEVSWPSSKNDYLNFEEWIIDPQADAALMMTSGTTGDPKSIVFTQEQLYQSGNALIPQLEMIFKTEKPTKSISWLPTYNATGRLLHTLSLIKEVPLYFVKDPRNIANSIYEIEPTVFFAPPRFYEKVYQEITNQIRKKGLIIEHLFHWSAVIKKWPILGAWFDTKIFKTLRSKVFGSNIQYLFSGSAPLRQDILAFFIKIGLPIYECYGMTEIAQLIAINTPDQRRWGSVGKITNGQNVIISDEGEVLIKGPTVFNGYLKDPSPQYFTKEGFYRSGDLGYLKDDYIYLTGRKKEIIKTSNGQRVSPQQIEHFFSEIEEIDFLIVIGDNLPYLTALISVDPIHFKEYKKMYGSNAEKNIRKELQVKIDKLNYTLSKKDRIHGFILIKDPLSLEKGQITRSLKIRREQLIKDFQKEIHTLYAVEESTG
ncbi:MAG: AMP-binding protein [Bdellovibrionales bacterium]|nr:AMP-binding protein [Bdellovibrionales bacterium]